MPTIWLIILYFIIKSVYWKKFFLYLGLIILLITSLPIVSTYVGKFFYSDNYRVSNHHKKPTYVLIPAGGIWYDGYEKWHPTYESIIRTQYGKELSNRFSIPTILSGAGSQKVKEANLISEYSTIVLGLIFCISSSEKSPFMKSTFSIFSIDFKSTDKIFPLVTFLLAT